MFSRSINIILEVIMHPGIGSTSENNNFESFFGANIADNQASRVAGGDARREINLQDVPCKAPHVSFSQSRSYS